MDDYDALLERLFRLEVARGWDLKLESVRAALGCLGHPERRFESILIAGTNGKGSTAAIAASILERAGHRVGLYISPHLIDFRERIRVGGEEIPRAAVTRGVARIERAILGQPIELTFFEVATVLAFLHFAETGVTRAVVEVGLGGRLDATNVLEPCASVVTTIGLDHERWLGSTPAAIAAEKGGIARHGVPLVLGRIEGVARDVLERIGRELGAPLVRLGVEFHADPERREQDRAFSGKDSRADETSNLGWMRPRGFADGEHFIWRGRPGIRPRSPDRADGRKGGPREIRDLRSGLIGRHQIDNAAVAIAALGAAEWLDGTDEETIRTAVAAVRWPGRLERIGERPLFLLDGAHNPAAVEVLVRELPALAAGRRMRLLFSALADKRIAEMAERLAPLVSDVTVAPVRERRAARVEDLLHAFAGRAPVRAEASVAAAIDRWLGEEASQEVVLVVAGSLFLVGEARATLVARGILST